MSIRSTKYLGEDVSRGYIKASTEALLAQLILHHDYSVKLPPTSIERRVVVKIKQPEPVEEKLEVCVLPIVITRITVNAIQRLVCQHFGISHTDMVSPRRDHKVMRPRQVAMYLAKEFTPMALPALGRSFHRDHTTVMSGIRKIARLVACNDPVIDELSYLREVLSA